MAEQREVRKIRAEMREPEKNHSRLKETSTTGQCGEGESKEALKEHGFCSPKVSSDLDNKQLVH